MSIFNKYENFIKNIVHKIEVFVEIAGMAMCCFGLFVIGLGFCVCYGLKELWRKRLWR